MYENVNRFFFEKMKPKKCKKCGKEFIPCGLQSYCSPTCGYKIAQRSKKRAKQNVEYLKLRQEYLLKHEECEAQHNGCTFFATDIHHKEGRIAHRLTDVSTFQAVCRTCHIFIENNNL